MAFFLHSISLEKNEEQALSYTVNGSAMSKIKVKETKAKIR